jgi:hypothetical protein
MIRTTLTVDIQYDERRTDPDALACAMDRLMETALSTPGILDECANPTVQEFHVAAVASSDLERYALRIDGDLLRRQRQLLLKLVDPLHRKLPDTSQVQTDLLEGVLAMLEEIADQAHDQYGIDCLLDEQAEDSQG